MHWRSEADCAALAGRLAAQLALRDAFIELHGPLGAGKTTLVRHLLRALGVTGRIKSPTFAVLEPYEIALADGTPLAVSHFDFYRFVDPREGLDAGFREVFAAPGLKLVEWPQNAGPWLPVPDLCLELEPLADEQRALVAHACSARGVQLLAAL